MEPYLPTERIIPFRTTSKDTVLIKNLCQADMVKVPLVQKAIRTILINSLSKLQKGWTTKTDARLQNGVPCLPEDARATSWSIWGAICSEDENWRLRMLTAWMVRLTINKTFPNAKSPCYWLNEWNDRDSTTWDNVVKVVKNTIEALKPNEGSNESR